MYIGDYLGRRALYTPERLAVIDTGKEPEWRLSYREMNERADRLARWLRDEAGIEKGDRVAILARDGVEHLDGFFACGKLGALHTALNTRLHARELARIVAEVRPKVFIFSDEHRETAAGLGSRVPISLHLAGIGIPGSRYYEECVQACPANPVICDEVIAEDIAALIFTSGTTGLPKAARISHRMIAWNTLNTVIHDLAHGDVHLNVFPLFHTGGLFVYTLPLLILGGTTILMPRFEPARVLELIKRERVTVFVGVPTMYQMMTEAPNWLDADLSSPRFCTAGGAALPVPLIERYAAEKGVRFKQGFGMSEFGPGVFALAPEDGLRKAGSVGRPNFFVDAAIVDEDGKPLADGEIGEIVLKGPAACSGYFGEGEALDDAGWLHTGDLAYRDPEGYYYIVDRKKDMFISGGENVYPIEVEQALYRHPAVHQCAVIGVPDPRWGEVGLACVVLRSGRDATEAELLDSLRAALARYKVPKRVVFLEALPLSAAGKVLKRELRARFAAP